MTNGLLPLHHMAALFSPNHLHLLPELVSVRLIYPWRSQGSLTSLQLVLATQWQPHLQLCHGNVWFEQKVIWSHVLMGNSKQVVCAQHSIWIKHIIQLSWRATKADLNFYLNVGKKISPKRNINTPQKVFDFQRHPKLFWARHHFLMAASLMGS